MRKTMLLLAAVFSLTAAGIYFGLPKHPETPPPYYSGVFWPNCLGTSYFTVYPDGARRIYIYENRQPVGSRLLSRNEELLEESTYQLLTDQKFPRLKIVQKKYYTFHGYLLVYVLPISLVLSALCLLVVAFQIIWSIRHRQLNI